MVPSAASGLVARSLAGSDEEHLCALAVSFVYEWLGRRGDLGHCQAGLEPHLHFNRAASLRFSIQVVSTMIEILRRHR